MPVSAPWPPAHMLRRPIVLVHHEQCRKPRMPLAPVCRNQSIKIRGWLVHESSTSPLHCMPSLAPQPVSCRAVALVGLGIATAFYTGFLSSFSGGSVPEEQVCPRMVMGVHSVCFVAIMSPCVLAQSESAAQAVAGPSLPALAVVLH